MSNVVILKGSSGASSRRASLPPGAFWTSFGTETLVCASDRASAQAAGAEFAAESVREETIDPEELFLVLQKGRLFQREHPNARVILDKGRFLVVHLPRDQREMVQVSEAPCYSIRSLPRNEAVFEVRPRVAARAPVPAIQAFVDRIDLERFRADVVALADLHTRHSFSTDYANAVEMVRTRLADLEFSVSLQDVTVGSKTTRNVIAERDGTTANGRGLVIAGAHLDSINHNGNAASRAPGADDNASGSAGVLEIARVLCDYRGSHDLRLILFGGEEQGLHGSRQLVAGLSATDKSRILAMINMDMISRRNTAATAVLIEGAPLSQTVIDIAVEAASTYTELDVETSLHPHDSDHVSFIDAGIPAVLTIEGSDGANGDVHTEGDTVATLDFTLMHQILRMNVAACANALKLE
jgi:Zn-dependent M28 family amino/carboxypeptidase